MIFSYDQYVLQLFVVPLLTILFGLVCIGSGLIRFITQFKRHEKASTLQIIKQVAALVIGISFLVIFIEPLRYGVPMLFEHKDESAVTAGNVSVIREATFSARYPDGNGQQRRASIVTIGDIDLYFAYTDELSVGDAIIVKYLPKSRVVTSYAVSGAEEASTLPKPKQISVWVLVRWFLPFCFAVAAFLFIVYYDKIKSFFSKNKKELPEKVHRLEVVPRDRGESLEPFLLIGALLAIVDLVLLHQWLWIVSLLMVFLYLMVRIRTKNEVMTYDQRGLLYRRGKIIIAAVPWKNVLRVYTKPGPFNRRWEHISYYVCVDYLDGNKKKELSFPQSGYYGTDEFIDYAEDVLKRQEEKIDQSGFV